MAQEDKSVRKTVQEIETRTGKLDKAIENLSESLDKIAASLAKQPEEEGPGREDLIKKFKQPFATPDAVKKEDGSNEILEQIKDALVFNQKDNFAMFKSIDDTLKKISDMGGMIGGGFDLPDRRGKSGKDGKPGKDVKASKTDVTPDKLDKQVAKEAAGKGATKAAGGTMSKIGGALAKGARFLPGVGLAVGAGMAASDAYSGFTEAEETLGIKDREATLGEKLSAGAGGLASGLTFGLLSRERAAKGIESARQGVMSFFGGGSKEEQPAGPVPAVTSAATTISKPKPQQTPTSTVKAAAPPPPPPAPTVTPTSTVTGETKNTSLPEGVTKDPMSGAYVYKGVMFQANNKEAIDAHMKVIDGGGEASFEDVDRNTGMKVQKTISGDESGVKIVSMKPVEGAKEGEELAPTSSSISPQTSTAEPSKQVNQMSQENAEMKAEGQAVQPIIMNNTSSVNSNTQSVAPIKTSPRPQNNSFERKQLETANY